jgi:polysaccharide export outer membrane protein
MRKTTSYLYFGLIFILSLSLNVPYTHSASGEELMGPTLQEEQGSKQTSPVIQSPFIIGPEDTLEVLIKDNPQISRRVLVRADGKITLPIIGDIEVGGRTPDQVTEIIREKAALYIREPVFVTVIVAASRNARVYMMGGGIGGRTLTLTRPTTLLQFLAQSGLSSQADLLRAYILRGGKKLSVDFEALVHLGDLKQNLLLEPDDLIFIPLIDHFPGRIKVLGEVGSQRTITYREGLTVLDAVLMVGGPTAFASPNGTKIIRINDAGEKVVLRVKLKNLLKGDLSKNVLLQPRDTIVVPQSFF